MTVEVKLTGLPGEIKKAKIVSVLVKAGDQVKAGQALFEAEGSKGAITISASAAGVVKSVKVNDGDTVEVGAVLAEIEALTESPKAQQSSEEGVGETFDYFNISPKPKDKPKDKELEADITIIGGGPGGYVAAIHAAKMGANVVLVEKDKVGGTCLNRGCIPTKALVRAAEVYDTIREAETFGFDVQRVSFDMGKVLARKTKVVEQLVRGIEYLLKKNGVKTIQGCGIIDDEQTVVVEQGKSKTKIRSKHIIIATGSKTATLPIPGAQSENVLDSNQALELQQLPRSLVIIGGGIIGMEFAFIYNSFGVEVSVIEFLDDILAVCDADICRVIRRIAKRKGIEVYTGAKAKEIVSTADGKCLVVFEQGGQSRYLVGDKVLMAVGRHPQLEGLGVEKLGIELNESGRGIKVNDKMQTSIPNIYAIGDVTNKVLLAHVASHQGIVAVNNILGKECAMDYRAVPSAIFTSPEIATVGLSEKMASEEGIEVEVGKFPFSANGKSVAYGHQDGFVKIIAEKASGKVLGAGIIGPHATDLIAELTLAVRNGLTAEQICETIHAHPTTAEAIHEAALDVEGGALHALSR